VTWHLAIVWGLSPFLRWLPASVRHWHARLRQGVRPNWIQSIVSAFLDEVQHLLPQAAVVQERQRAWTSNVHEVGSVNLYEQRRVLAAADTTSRPPAASRVYTSSQLSVEPSSSAKRVSAITITRPCAVREIENDVLKLYKSLSELMTC